jgi:hypothetical protein
VVEGCYERRSTSEPIMAVPVLVGVHRSSEAESGTAGAGGGTPTGGSDSLTGEALSTLSAGTSLASDWEAVAPCQWLWVAIERVFRKDSNPPS